ncbi:hypothetical protein AAIR29_00040 [Psychrobacter sp. FBL11]|uniref:Uncharacterized protein n=1 Tax=Psychrobacter saeujeotis TaxID=3143436 RepID=A0ABU9X3N3_9GAMM
MGDDEMNGYATILYESQNRSPSSPFSFNKNYRAVLMVGDGDAVSALKTELQEIAELFYEAVAVDKKNYDPNNKPKLPVYIPRFLDDNDELFKIQIHENKAHSSENLTKTDMVTLASCPRGSLSRLIDEKRSVRRVLEAAAGVLENDGYTVVIEDKNLSPYYTLSVDVKTLCEKHECDSIQRRFFTGRQIRANFFTEKDDIVQKSKLATVGVVLVTKPVEVVHSLDRSVRTDAKYTKKHIDEIVFEEIPELFRSGRLYKIYDTP